MLNPTATSHPTLIHPIFERARREPDDLALVIVHEDGTHERVPVATLHAEALAYAQGLEAAKVGVDDVVILALPHSRDLITALVGMLYRGAIPAVFSAYIGPKQDLGPHRSRLATLVANAGARAVVTLAEHTRAAQAIVPHDGRCVALACDALKKNDGGRAAPDMPVHPPEKLAFLQYTSGTGGAQKGVAHTHRGVMRYIESKRRAQPIGADDVVVSWLPLYHDLGLVSGVLAPLILGVPSVLMSPTHWIRDPKILFRAVHEFRGTMCFMPNFALNHCARTIRDRDLEDLELGHWKDIVIGGEPVRSDSLQMFAERFGRHGMANLSLRPGYGMAELVEGAFVTPRGRPPRVDWIDVGALQRERRAEPRSAEAPGSVSVLSCGRPMPGMEGRIVGESGQPLADRCVGEILLRSDYQFDGYYRRPDLTAESVRDGWLVTADLGYIADGELYVTGRKKDLIIVGGRNVHPEDVELLADGVPGLQPGRAVAFGVPDPSSGTERTVLICEAAADSAAEGLSIERHLRRKAVEQMDVRLGEVRLVGRGWIIKTSSGKIARAANREKYLAEFGASPASPPVADE